MDKLSNEVLIQIFENLRYPALKQLSSCCRRFNDIVHRNFIDMVKIQFIGNPGRSIACLLDSSRPYQNITINNVDRNNYETFRANGLQVIKCHGLSIQSLDINYMDLNNQQYVEILENLPNLKNLIYCPWNNRSLCLFSENMSNLTVLEGRNHTIQLTKLVLDGFLVLEIQMINLNIFLSTQNRLIDVNLNLNRNDGHYVNDFDMINLLRNTHLKKFELNFLYVLSSVPINIENMSITHLISKNFQQIHLLIKQMPNLQILDIIDLYDPEGEIYDAGNNLIESRLIRNILELRNLIKLKLNTQHIEVVGIGELVNLSIIEVSIAGEILATNLIKHMPNINNLKIEIFENLDFPLIFGISKLQNLKTLEIRSIEMGLPDSIPIEVLRCPALESLSLYNLHHITFASWNLVVNQIPNIRELNIYNSNCQTSFDLGSLKLILENLNHLEKLGYLSGEFGEACVNLIFKNIKNLKEVRFYDSRRTLSDEALKMMADNNQIRIMGLNKKSGALRYHNRYIRMNM